MTNAVRHCVLNAKSLWRRQLFILVLAARAALSSWCQSSEPAVIQASREIGVSFSASYIAYTENGDNGFVDSEHGWVPGVGAKVTENFDALKLTNLLVWATYDFNYGNTNHLNAGSALITPAGFRSNDLSFWLGKGFLPAPNLLLTAEPEAEYREWLRLLPNGEFDTRENYTFWAPGLALGASYSPRSSLVMKAKAGFEYTVSPVNAGNGKPNPSSQIPAPVPAVNLILRPHALWQVEEGGDWALTHAIHVYADASYSRFGFGRSVNYHFDNGDYYHYEPSSVTNLLRIDAGLAWAF
jgi:hypothetical protein